MGSKTRILTKNTVFDMHENFAPCLVPMPQLVQNCVYTKKQQKQYLHSKIMPQRRHLTQDERQRALGYLLAGQTQCQASTEFNFNQIGVLLKFKFSKKNLSHRPKG